jgi:protein involved in sex pheromone biosynthesis
MISKRGMAKESRVKDLDDEILESTFFNYAGQEITQEIINPLPHPDDEKDLTTFITLWKEGKDKSMAETVDNCQTAENVIKKLQLKMVEAMSQYDYAKIEWCQSYID